MTAIEIHERLYTEIMLMARIITGEYSAELEAPMLSTESSTMGARFRTEQCDSASSYVLGRFLF